MAREGITSGGGCAWLERNCFNKLKVAGLAIILQMQIAIIWILIDSYFIVFHITV